MGTRSGDIDPAVVQYICNKENKSVDEVLNILNKKSGLLGMSGGLSSDCRDITAAAEEGHHLAKVTLDAYTYRIAKYVGSYAAAMNGVDAIAFTAGVGENDIEIREELCEKYWGYLGVKIDKEANPHQRREQGYLRCRFQGQSYGYPNQRRACHRKRHPGSHLSFQKLQGRCPFGQRPFLCAFSINRKSRTNFLFSPLAFLTICCTIETAAYILPLYFWKGRFLMLTQEHLQDALDYGRCFIKFGKPASYIPELARVNKYHLGVCVVGLDGKHHGVRRLARAVHHPEHLQAGPR